MGSTFFWLISCLCFATVLGECRWNDVPHFPQFDIDRFAGKEWYTIQAVRMYGNSVSSAKCESENFASTENDLEYRVNANGIETEPTYSNVSLSLFVYLEPEDYSVMKLTENNIAVLMDTDYDNWSLWYRCSIDTETGATEEISVIRSRARHMDENTLESLRQQVLALGFPDNFYTDPQTEC